MMTVPPARHDEPDGPDGRVRWVLRAVVVSPIVVAVVRALGNGWFPVGDNALLTVRAADVATRHHPLLGSWTSASLALGIDVNNPGPLYSDLIAPFMWTFGKVFSYGAGSAIGVGTVNASAALGTVLVANRAGGWRAERWALLLVAALTWAMGSELLFDIWQPHALLLPFTFLVVLTAAISAGDLRLLPVWIGVLSVVVQTHIGYAYVGVALAAVVAWAVIDRLRCAEHRRDLLLGRIARWTVGVAVVAWVQPVWEQLFGEGQGNLSRLATSAGGGDLTVGPRTAVRLLAAVAVVPPGWTRFGFEDAVPSAGLTHGPDGPRLEIPGLPGLGVAVLGLFALVGVLAVLVWRLRAPEQRFVRRVVGLSLLLIGVALGSVSIQVVTVTGLGNHQVRWLFAAAAIAHVAVLWGAAELCFTRVAGPATRAVDAAILAVSALLVVTNLPYLAHDLGPTRDATVATTLRRVFDDLDEFEPAEPVLYDLDHISVFEPYSAAVLMRFHELGVEFRIDHEGHLRQYGTSRRADGDEPVALRQYERDDALLYTGPGCVVSRRSGVDPAAERSADELLAAAAAELVAGPAVTVDGLPADIAGLVTAATAGDRDAAARVVARGLLPVLVDEGRIEPGPAVAAAATPGATDAIVRRVNSTYAVVATPATACD